MINSRKELKDIINEEKRIYLQCEPIIKRVTCDQQYLTFKFLKFIRYMEYYHNKKNYLMYLFYRRRKNKLGIRLGIEIQDNCIDRGLVIYHPSNIVINGYSKIGKNCKLHGNNCIGNNGKDDKAPVIGNNVRICVGANIIGDVYIADDIVVGAGAVVISSFYEKGITIGGVPARKLK